PTVGLRATTPATPAGAIICAVSVDVSKPMVRAARPAREARRLAAEATGELRQAEFAEDREPVLTQLLRDAGIRCREVLPQRIIAGRRVHALHVNEVFQQDGKTVCGTPDMPLGALHVQLRGVLQRVLVELGDRVKSGAALVQRLNAVDISLGERDRG